MVIEEISADQVLAVSRAALGLPLTGDLSVDVLLAASIRRAASILCPCARSTLVRAVGESLQHLVEDTGDLSERIDAVLEGLVIGGDLLELSNVATDNSNAKSTWVFPAPPAFVPRPSGRVFILGIVPDEASPLPSSLSARLTHEGFTRVLVPQDSENLPAVLRGLGLLEMTETAWLRAPKQESAIDFRDGMARRLSNQPPSGNISDLTVLDPAKSPTYYRGRWIAPRSETGTYVARRPQAYGAPLWGVADLKDGAALRFLDFPLKGSRWRGADMAWHLQMAIDHLRGAPQLYRRVVQPNGIRLDFFSPLPLWAQRRLSIVGQPAQAEKCLFSYMISEQDAAAEEAFLQQRLWLTASKEGGAA